MIQGTTVTLYEQQLSGVDALNNPVYTPVPVTVAHVLVARPTTDDIAQSLQLYGKRAEYVLGLPKGDSHDWEGAEVDIFGQRYRAFGEVLEGIEANVPGPWHKQVRVARYE